MFKINPSCDYHVLDRWAGKVGVPPFLVHDEPCDTAAIDHEYPRGPWGWLFVIGGDAIGSPVPGCTRTA
jgi:hypothetical protein